MTTPTLDRRLQQVAGFALLVSVCHAQSRATSLLSVSPSGAQGNGSSGTVATVLSADGRIVVFASQATNLVSGDTNGMPDVFLRDLQAGTIERVNLTSTGAEDNGGGGLPGGVSFDGRFVAFWSFGTNLVPSDTNGSTDVFVRDRQNGTTERVSVSSAGVEANGYSFSPSISGDGRYIAFESTAANLGAPVGGYGAFVHDRLTGTTEAIPSSLTLTNLGDGNLSISGDGRYLAYVAPEPFYANLPSIYVYDRQLQTSILASPGTETGNSPNNWCMYPALSADGRYVAFVSAATDLVGGDMNGSTIDVFVRDLQLHSTSIATVDSSGVQGNSDSFGHPQISPDGRFVTFASSATNLVAGDTNAADDVFVHDRLTGFTSRVSVDSSGVQANSQSYAPSVSGDGRYVVFGSDASNLVVGDTNGLSDIFLRDRGVPMPATYCTAKVDSLGCTPSIGYSGLPTISTGPDNFFITATNVLNNKSGIMLWGGAQASTPFFGGTLCIAPPIIRTSIQSSGGNPPPSDCSGSYSYHFSQAYMTSHFLSAGSTVYAQYWSRDPGFAFPNNIGLTDGVMFVIAP